MGALRKPEFITVGQFLDMRLPESHQWELVDGVVYSVTLATVRHSTVQMNLADLLRRCFKRSCVVLTEYPYALDQYSLHAADVGAVSVDRYSIEDASLDGAPDLVIEVVSPSNRAGSMKRLQQRCLSNGCVSFWRVYPKKQVVAVAAMNEAGCVVETLYGIDDDIPVSLFGRKGAIPVRKIFQSPA